VNLTISTGTCRNRLTFHKGRHGFQGADGSYPGYHGTLLRMELTWEIRNGGRKCHFWYRSL
jgi:hypothetical protein